MGLELVHFGNNKNNKTKKSGGIQMIRKTEKDRLLWMDCLKVFATFLVVMQHSISYEWVSLIDKTNITWKIINFVFMLSKAGVPIFIMCSGIGMLKKERTITDICTKNIANILKVYVCWMLVYGIYHVYLLFCAGTATVRVVFNALIKDIIFGQYHTWYIATLVALYLITPFLFLIVKSKTKTQYFLILSFIFTIIIPYVGKYESLSRLYTVLTDMNMKFVVGYALYFVLGHYVSKIKLTGKRKIIVMLSLVISIVLAFRISCLSAVNQGADCQNIYSDFSILGFVISVCILLLFRMIFENDFQQSFTSEHYRRFRNAIVNMSSYGIGIYLLHPLLLFLVKDLKGLKCLAGGIFLWMFTMIIVWMVSLSPFRKFFLGSRKRESQH